MKEAVLLGHVLFGVGCLVTTLWLLVDVLNAHEGNLARIRWLSRAAAICIWLAFVVGGYWYVADYKADREVILAGPWPFARGYFMASVLTIGTSRLTWVRRSGGHLNGSDQRFARRLP